MTEDAINKAIFDASGWVEDFDEEDYCRNTITGRTRSGTWKDFRFTSDLNDIHEAESVLDHQQQFTYHDELHKICGKGKRHPCYESIRATAEQRSEALVKTLKLWIDEI